MISNKKMSNFFECSQCGDCCSGQGGTYVDKKKIEEIASFLNITIEKLKKEYLCLSSTGRYMIACGKDGKCIFFNKNCSIHPVKPRMCREWPFIPAVIKVPENWEQMAEACPGIKKQSSRAELNSFILESLKTTRTKEELGKLEKFAK
ncbi:MAG: YkgJ family cysteine cluster protein [Desulforegulaceae bacterium]|nr:YkgJ family cysteine cluster protein [Desulforegulaceae bacterium]